MIQLRECQVIAIQKTKQHWANGIRSVCVVAPTGGGKTVIGTHSIGPDRALWVVHRRELANQARKHLEHMGERPAVVMAGMQMDSSARILIGTIQTLLRRDLTALRPKLIVLDEAHHFCADEYRKITEAFPDTLTLGLTATPERQDGRPLGDIFEKLVEVATYSEMLDLEQIVHTDVVRPTEDLGPNLLMDPVEAWFKYANGQPTFANFSRVNIASQHAARFVSRGVRAAVIHAHTGKRERDDLMAMFRGGTIRVLCNVNTLTEGVDVPEASVSISARPFAHASTMMQTFGRVLRASPGKTRATCIDLTGSTHRLGMPTDDRIYSLEGRAISGGTGEDEGRDGPGESDFEQEIVGGVCEIVSSDGHSRAASEMFAGAQMLSAKTFEAIRKRRGARAAEEAALSYQRQL